MKNVNENETQKHNSSDNLDFEYSWNLLEEQISDMEDDVLTEDDIDEIKYLEMYDIMYDEEIESEREYFKGVYNRCIDYHITCNDEAKNSLTEKVEGIKPAIGDEVYRYLIELLEREEKRLKIVSIKIWHPVASEQEIEEYYNELQKREETHKMVLHQQNN